MTARLLLSGLAALGLLSVGLAGQESPPPGHPPITPPGHPPITAPADPTAVAMPLADARDVVSPESIVKAYYESISGPGGQARDWTRFRSLFLPDARFTTMRDGGVRMTPLVIDVDTYIKMNDTYFTRGGYFESEIGSRTESFGHIGHVFSTYASRRKADAPEPYSRGMNSFQLVHDGVRWWISSMAWDRERPNESPLPAKYLEVQ